MDPEPTCLIFDGMVAMQVMQADFVVRIDAKELTSPSENKYKTDLFPSNRTFDRHCRERISHGLSLLSSTSGFWKTGKKL